MTEAEWLAWPASMPLAALNNWQLESDRKLRPFTCACCRRVGHLLADARSWRAGAGRCPCGDFPYTRAAEMPQVGTTVTVATAGLIAGC